MAGTYSFTIPANYLEAGVPASNTEITLDRGFTRNFTPKALSASFGDGYSQRAKDGINYKQEQIDFSLNNRTAEEVDLVAEFLNEIAPGSFELTVTERGIDRTMRVRCPEFSANYIQDNYRSLRGKFIRVFEP